MEKFISAISLIAALLTIGDVIWKIINNQNYNITAVLIVIAMTIIFQLFISLITGLDVNKKDDYIPVIVYIYIPLIIVTSVSSYFRMVINTNIGYTNFLLEAFKLSVMIIVTTFLYLFWSNMFDTRFHKNKLLHGFVFGLTSSSIIGIIVYLYIINNKPTDNSLWGFVLIAFTITLASALTRLFPLDKGDKVKEESLNVIRESKEPKKKH